MPKLRSDHVATDCDCEMCRQWWEDTESQREQAALAGLLTFEGEKMEPAWSTSALEKCVQCESFVYATKHLDEEGRLMDSEGGMFFDDGFVCDRCLAQERAHDLESN